MRLSRIFRKDFFITLFIKQNKWHKYGVLLHTLSVVYHTIKAKQYKMLAAAFLHDLGKPILAYQDKEDLKSHEYSFTNHEELSYQLIKNWPFISTYSKKLVRYHYLLRGMSNAKKRQDINKYNRMKRIYDKLDDDFIKKLKIFVILDDLGKK